MAQGWQGKLKRMLQVLWECGFIDVTNINQYMVGKRKDEMAVLQTETSLKFLLGNCLDCEEGRILGAKINRTPKCHSKLAGKRTEYSWGCGQFFCLPAAIKG
jgi:hypothetical protein